MAIPIQVLEARTDIWFLDECCIVFVSLTHHWQLAMLVAARLSRHGEKSAAYSKTATAEPLITFKEKNSPEAEEVDRLPSFSQFRWEFWIVVAVVKFS